MGQGHGPRPLLMLAQQLLVAACLLTPLTALAVEETGSPKFDAQALDFFEKKVRPLLVKRCYECHSGQSEEPKGGLRLDSRAAVVAGGDTGAAVVPGKPQKSLLVDAINYGDLYEMPPKSKMPPEEIALLTKWVKLGAPWPPEKVQPLSVKREEFDLQARKADHWCWQPIGSPEPPDAKQGDWPRSDIDRFILARLEEKGLQPSPPADRRVLVRRLYFDLIGLPPTPQQVEQFIADDRPDAYERLVDRLLASQHFGERWARHWLDLVRYAESRGHEFDYDIPNPWHYRDYVNRALNADVPYNRFIIEHVAGDLVDEPRRHPERGFNESILGTGFWFLGEWVHSPVDTRQDETDRFDNMVDVATKTFLGLTVACARCHDHKFDAISQRDYYALFGYLQSSSFRLARFETMDHNGRIADALAALKQQTRRRLVEGFTDAWRPQLARLDDYLLAAREVLTDLPQVGGRNTFTAELRERAAKVAHRRKLDATLLERLIHAVIAARGEKDALLHPWALVCFPADEKQLTKDALAGQLEAIARAWTEQQRATLGIPAEDPAEDIVVDYGTADQTQWMTDGTIFGRGPVRPGELRLPTSEKHTLQLEMLGAARRDPAWNGLKEKGGVQRHTGSLGFVRSGRTIKTPTFEVTGQMVWYLVSGAGHAFAAVDSYYINKGPLYGKLVRKWGDKPGEVYFWVGHDLADHRGHKVHIELTPTGTSPLAVHMIVQGDRRPPRLPTFGPAGDRTAKLLGGEATAEALASRYKDLLIKAADRLGKVDAERKITPLLAWLIDNRTLLTNDTGEKPILSEYLTRRSKLTAQIESESHLAMAMWEGSPENEHLLIRGSHKTPGDVVPRRFLEALGGKSLRSSGETSSEGLPRNATGSGRLQLARAIASPDNPLTARVLVNRVWHHLLGRGLVASVDNFGVLGHPPSHPQLLDHLATGFVEDDWSVKRLIRRFVMSRTYRQSSKIRPEAENVDPQNLLLWRMPIRRLEGEVIRDAMLAVSGRLDRRMFGPSVPVHLTPFMTGRGRPQGGPLGGSGRRSIYIAVRRNFLPPMMLAFDTPSPFSTMGRRNVSNVPAQALILMNDPFVAGQAKLWAARTLADKQQSARQRIERLYRDAFARGPDTDEASQALAFLRSQAQAYGLDPSKPVTDPRPWADLCHVLFNVKEFIFLK